MSLPNSTGSCSTNGPTAPAGKNPSQNFGNTGKLSRNDNIKAVSLILKEEECHYDLVPFEKFKYGRNLWSERYRSFFVLCALNTHKDVGWLVCRYVTSNTCKIPSALLAFSTANGGTGRLERHIKHHEMASSSTMTIPHPLPLPAKSALARAVAFVLALDLRPVSFTDGKPGMTHFVDAIFRAGQATAVGDHILPASLMPSAKTVRNSLAKLAPECVTFYKCERLPCLLSIGAGLSTDGVYLKVNGMQFYDLTIQYVDIQESCRLDQDVKIAMECKTLLLKEKPEYASGDNIRAMLDSALLAHYDVSIGSLTKQFTMVIDCASVMARVAQSSVSSRVAPADVKWLGCLSHMLNTAMKGLVNGLQITPELEAVFLDPQHVKTIVRIFKQSGANTSLSNGFRLVQDVDHRFGSTFAVVERFLKSITIARDVIAEKHWPAASRVYDALTTEKDRSGAVLGYPALEALIDAFGAIVEAQTRVQASRNPTMHLALPLMQSCYDEPSRIASAGAVWGGQRGQIPPSDLSRRVCRFMMEWLDATARVHDMWLVGCLMLPFLRDFQFISSSDKRRDYTGRACAMTRTLTDRFTEDGDSTGNGPGNDDNATVPGLSARNMGSRGVGPAFGERVGEKRSFTLMSYADSHFQSVTAADELSRYLAMDISSLGIERKAFMEDDFAQLKFWHRHKGSFPTLFNVARRVYGTPVTSAASERVFSALARIITRDRAAICADTLEDIILVRSLK